MMTHASQVDGRLQDMLTMGLFMFKYLYFCRGYRYRSAVCVIVVTAEVLFLVLGVEGGKVKLIINSWKTGKLMKKSPIIDC